MNLIDIISPKKQMIKKYFYSVNENNINTNDINVNQKLNIMQLEMKLQHL